MLLNKIKNYFSSKEKLRRKLLPLQFNHYEKIVKESKGIISWEKLEKHTFFYDHWFLIWIYWDLDLSWIPIDNLNNIINRTYLINIIDVINKKIRLKIMYNWINMEPYMNLFNSIDINSYIKIYNFLIYLQDFGNEIIDDKILNNHKKEFINRYWIWITKRDFSVKKELDVLANVFFYKFIENYLKEIEKINLMKNNWVCEEERKNYAKEVYKKLEEKLDYIEYYFWEEIKNRICDELQRAIRKTN